MTPDPVNDNAPSAPTRTVEVSLAVIALLAAIGAARVAEPFLVPVIIGILMSYMLRPLVSMLETLHIPRIVGAALVLSILVALASAAAYSIRDDLSDAIAELPIAARKLRQAMAAGSQSAGPMTHMQDAAAELNKAAAEATGKTPASAAPPATGVAAQFQDFVAQQSAKALSVLTEIFLALLLALLLLAAGDTFRRKVAKLAGASLARRRVTVEVLNEIDAHIQAYMLTLLVVNALIALATWAALFLLGLPNAGMWGAVTGVLHIIPYAGTVLAAAAVGIAMFVQTGNFGDAFVAMGAVTAIAIALGMGLATWMQGRATQMNAVAVFIAVLFFGWLWGGWGLLLGMPILVTLKSIADRVEAMQPISELLAG